MKYLIFIVLFFSPFFSKAQTGHRLVYDLKYQIDSTDSNSIRNESFYLDRFDNESYFLSQNQFLSDSFMLNPNEKQMFDAFLDLKTRPKFTKFHYIVNVKNNSIKHYEKIVMQKFAYKEEVSLDWKLSDDTLRIANYLCQKATTHFAGRDYTAWYTTQIPLTAAPYKFTGLLGTIVRIVDSKNHYQFDLLEIQTTQKSIVYKAVDEQEKMLAKKEFWNTRKKINENPELRYAGTFLASSAGNDERLKKNTEARLKRENNPIELE